MKLTRREANKSLLGAIALPSIILPKSRPTFGLPPAYSTIMAWLFACPERPTRIKLTSIADLKPGDEVLLPRLLPSTWIKWFEANGHNYEMAFTVHSLKKVHSDKISLTLYRDERTLTSKEFDALTIRKL